MKTSLVFLSEPEKWEPRKRLGVPDNIGHEQRDLLDAIDIIEQKADFSNMVSIRAYYLALVLLGIILLTNGTAALRIVQGWIGSQHTVATTAP